MFLGLILVKNPYSSFNGECPMSKQEREKSALLAVFPTLDSFNQFCVTSGNARIVQSFIDYAVRNAFIDSGDENRLREFIRGNAKGFEDRTPPEYLNFEELLEKKEDLLGLTLSTRALTERINALLAEHKIDLPKVSNSMLTRLKKEPADTPHKQNVLRSLAFWIGYERAHLGPRLNFETLLKLCREGKQSVNYTEGVRIGFALYSRGDIIGQEIVTWLKKDLKDYIEQSMGRFLYGRWGKVRSHDITTLYVDFPKEEEASNPALYRQCLRSAVSLAHQMAIRWALSKYCTKNRFLSIGIAAGDYASIDNYLLPLLNAKLPGDPVIRMTDYARQCLLTNDIRALLCSRPNEMTLFNGETLTIWWVVGFWSEMYFDFVPVLLRDRLLQNNPASIEALTRLIWPPEKIELQPDTSDESNAVMTFYRFPHNSLLGIEIAKTLYYRRRFWEAIEILRICLSIDPTHLHARTLRLLLFRNLALDAPSYPIAESLFQQAEQEALYIEENCAFPTEDFYCEHAVVYLARAMSTLRYMREGNGFFYGKADIRRYKRMIFAWLNKAETLFEKGMTVSPSAIRSSYLLDSVRVLQAILQNDDEIFINPEKPIDGKPDIVKQPSKNLQWQFGYLREDLPQEHQYDFMEAMLNKSVWIHDDSISLQAYRATTHFCTAVVWWDFFPVRTIAVVKRALQLLYDALAMAKAAEKDGVCIYSFTRTYGEMMPAQEFIRHMKRSIRMIETKAGDLSKRDDREIIEPDSDFSSILMTLNF
jgi:tetratricopeptide (TPR) repeat protein